MNDERIATKRDNLSRSIPAAIDDVKVSLGQNWGFYGRDQEMASLAVKLQIETQNHDRPFFLCTAITGRRGVGKNALLENTMRRFNTEQARARQKRPEHGRNGTDNLFLFELPPNMTPEGYVPPNGTWPYDVECLIAMLDQLRESPFWPLVADHEVARRDPRHGSPTWSMARLIQRLVYADVVVALDEIHNAHDKSILPGNLKYLIDGLTRNVKGILTATGKRRPTGQLVLMGSHQQKFHRMLGAKQPLHGRVDNCLSLRPWMPSQIWEMARDQGWDRHPARLHALWSAFGGIPRHWERFATSLDTPSILHEGWAPTKDHPRAVQRRDREWLQRFVVHEARILHDGENQRWDDRSVIELTPGMASAFLTMGRDIAPGQILSTSFIFKHMTPDPAIPDADTLESKLDLLSREVKIVKGRAKYTGHDNDQMAWYVTDNTALFQMNIAPDLFQIRHRTQGDESLAPRQLYEAQARHEGVMAERWVVEALKQSPHVLQGWSGAWPLLGEGQEAKGDIDGLVRFMQDPQDYGQHDLLLCINAKRNSNDHKIEDFQKIVDDFMCEDINLDKNLDRIKDLPRRHLFFSPVFRPRDMKRIRAGGHLAFDIRTLAAEMEADWPQIRAQLAIALIEPVPGMKTVPRQGPKPE